MSNTCRGESLQQKRGPPGVQGLNYTTHSVSMRCESNIFQMYFTFVFTKHLAGLVFFITPFGGCWSGPPMEEWGKETAFSILSSYWVSIICTVVVTLLKFGLQAYITEKCSLELLNKINLKNILLIAEMENLYIFNHPCSTNFLTFIY